MRNDPLSASGLRPAVSPYPLTSPMNCGIFSATVPTAQLEIAVTDYHALVRRRLPPVSAHRSSTS